MFSGYAELTALAPEEYLNWERFETVYDGWVCNSDLASRQYEKGLRIGAEYETIAISANGTWCASKSNCLCSSYEGIGYHAGTKDLLRGFLDSGTPIVVYRYGQSEGVSITERSTE